MRIIEVLIVVSEREWIVNLLSNRHLCQLSLSVCQICARLNLVLAFAAPIGLHADTSDLESYASHGSGDLGSCMDLGGSALKISVAMRLRLRLTVSGMHL